MQDLIVATYHQHFINWRLDLDVDGQMNSAMEMKAEALPPNSTTNPWLNAFGVQESPSPIVDSTPGSFYKPSLVGHAVSAERAVQCG